MRRELGRARCARFATEHERVGILSRWIWIAGVALLSACDGDAPPPEAQPRAPVAKPAAPSEKALATAKLVEGMVAAVRADESPAAVAVKFDLRSRPEIGKPLTIHLVFIPQISGTALSSTFVCEQGLMVPAGQAPAEFASVEAGAGYTYDLSVVPDSNGVHYVSAIVQLQAPGQPRIQTFSVPVVVGSPPMG